MALKKEEQIETIIGSNKYGIYRQNNHFIFADYQYLSIETREQVLASHMREDVVRRFL